MLRYQLVKLNARTTKQKCFVKFCQKKCHSLTNFALFWSNIRKKKLQILKG